MIRCELMSLLSQQGRTFSFLNSDVYDGFDLLHPAQHEIERCMGGWNSFLEQMALYQAWAAGLSPNPLEFVPGVGTQQLKRESSMRATGAWAIFCNQSLRVQYTYCCAFD